MRETQINSKSKLITITRTDMPYGYQLIQTIHSAIDFQHEHPMLSKIWNTQSNYLASLAVKDETELENFIQKFSDKNLLFTVFREPDINNSITSITIEPSEMARKLCSNLPLLFKNLK